MKKIVLTMAAAAISLGAFAQAHATDESNVTSDQVIINGSLTMVDMIDLVPENQFATNTANTWAEYNNGLQLIEATPGTPPLPVVGSNDIEMRVSATRPFSVRIKNGTWTRVAFPAAASGVLLTFAPTDFNCQGLASPEMTGIQTPGHPTIPVAGTWGAGYGGGSCGANSGVQTMSASDQTLLTANGCYDRRFDIRVALRPGYAYNHSGTYNGVITMTAALN